MCKLRLYNQIHVTVGMCTNGYITSLVTQPCNLKSTDITDLILLQKNALGTQKTMVQQSQLLKMWAYFGFLQIGSHIKISFLAGGYKHLDSLIRWGFHLTQQYQGLLFSLPKRKMQYVSYKNMGQLKGNLMPAHGQWVQHPGVIIAVFITSMWVPVVIFPVSSKACL